jgi:hypothetical protein
MIGAAVGAVVGVLFGPLVLATAAGGAALGGLVAKLHDSGFDDKRLHELGSNLQPGTSAIVAVIDHVWVNELEAELQKAGADTVTQQLGTDIAEQLKSGHDVAYTAIAAGDTAVVARATSAPTPEVEGAKAAAAIPAATESSDSSAPAHADSPTTSTSSSTKGAASPPSTPAPVDKPEP